jgi:hypothetical protein
MCWGVGVLARHYRFSGLGVPGWVVFVRMFLSWKVPHGSESEVPNERELSGCWFGGLRAKHSNRYGAFRWIPLDAVDGLCCIIPAVDTRNADGSDKARV